MKRQQTSHGALELGHDLAPRRLRRFLFARTHSALVGQRDSACDVYQYCNTKMGQKPGRQRHSLHTVL